MTSALKKADASTDVGRILAEKVCRTCAAPEFEKTTAKVPKSFRFCYRAVFWRMIWSNAPMKVGALIVAAGRGVRFGEAVPKQYHPLWGRPALRHSLALFAAHPLIAVVRTVIRPDDRLFYETAAAGLNLDAPVMGGKERQDSVRLGLESLAETGLDVVLIHDGARPFATRALVDRLLQMLENSTDEALAGVVPAVAVSDTLKKSEDGLIVGTVSRDGLWAAQTPQAFRFKAILAAHRLAAGKTFTDDAAVLEAGGGGVLLAPGDAGNVKITVPGDLDAFARTTTTWETRVGSGFDVHAFVEGSFLTLCGVEIPSDKALLGHSDADVALHAVTDALYGAIGAGDLGLHFPPSDPGWKGEASRVFLQHAVSLIAGLGGSIGNIDVTIVCERPKIGPHRGLMIRSLAALLSLGTERVSVKATTTEGLGFAGRGEGIAVQATATVAMPSRQIERFG